jgi:hypothetical protein
LLIGCSSGWIVDSGPLVCNFERRRVAVDAFSHKNYLAIVPDRCLGVRFAARHRFRT